MTRTAILAVGFAVAAGTLHEAAGQRSAAAALQPSLTDGTRSAVTRLLPGTRLDVLSTILGNALTSTNGQLPNVPVRLRDARIGRIVDTQFTDRAGSFAFTVVDPGTYVVEIIGTDRTVLAASQLVSVNAGEAVSAVVKLPFRIPPFAGLLGNTTSAAIAVTTAAASSGLLATTTAGEPESAVR